jgi:hypothetical protein
MKKKEDKIVNFMNIKGVDLFRVVFEFSQDADNCQPDRDLGQSIRIFTEDGGGGSFAVIETERWAVDHDEIDKLTDCIKRIVSLPEVV